MRLGKNSAFTLLEIMISVLVLTVVLLGLLSGYIIVDRGHWCWNDLA